MEAAGGDRIVVAAANLSGHMRDARSSRWAATEHLHTLCVGPTMGARRSSSPVLMRKSVITSYISYRGAPAMDTNALEQLILRVAELTSDFPEVSELDLNPVVAVTPGAAALDIKITLAPATEEPDAYVRSLTAPRAHQPTQ
jgi:ATP-grasp domain